MDGELKVFTVNRFIGQVSCLTGACRVLKFNPPVEGHSLQGHVFNSFKVQRESACEARCFVEHNCVSYNLGPLDRDGLYICELSDSVHQMHPEALVRQIGFTYRPTEVSLLTLLKRIAPTFINVKAK